MHGVVHCWHWKLALMKDDELQINVQDVPSKYPVEQERHDVADVHYLQGAWHYVHVLFDGLA